MAASKTNQLTSLLSSLSSGRKIISILMDKGLDTGSDPKVAQGFSKLENVQMVRLGALSQRDKLVTVNSYSGTFGHLGKLGKTPVFFDNNGIKVYNGTSFISMTSMPGTIRGTRINTTDVGRDAGQVVRPTGIFVIGNYVLMLYRALYASTAGYLYLNIFDKTSMTLIDSYQLESFAADDYNANGVFVQLTGEDHVLFIYPAQTGTALKVGEFSSAGTYTAPVTLTVTNAIDSTNDYFFIDACKNDTGDNYGVVFIHNDGGTKKPVFVIFSRVSAGVYTNDFEEMYAVTGDCKGVACFGLGARYVVLQSDDGYANPALCVKEYDYLGTVTAALASFTSHANGYAAFGGADMNDGRGMIIANVANNIVSPNNTLSLLQYATYTANGNVSSVYTLMGHSRMLSRPVWYSDANGDQHYVFVGAFIDDFENAFNSGAYQSDQSFYFVARVKEPTGMAELIAVGGFGKLSWNPIMFGNDPSFYVPYDAYLDNTNKALYFVVSNKIDLKAEEQYLSIIKVELDKEDHFIETPGNVIISSGGLPRVFDGRQFVEQGFLCYPTIKFASATGGSMAAGDYYYAATFDWVDGDGNIVRSGRSVPSPDATGKVTCAASGKVNISYSVLWHTDKISDNSRAPGKPVITLWRTPVNKQDFHKLKTIDLTTATAGFSTYTDSYSDAQVGLSYTEKLYTTGGVLENSPPPVYYISCIFQNRQFCVDEENSDRIRYSKEFARKDPADFTLGYAVEHSDGLFIHAPYDGEKITALAALDDKLIIFKESKIYMTYGEPLDDTGAGANYVRPLLVSQNIGCRSHKTLAKIEGGILFDSGRGIFMLTRGMELIDHGEPVKYYYEKTTIQDAVVDARNHQVIFCGDPADNVSLVYNYKYQAWSTFGFGARSAAYVDNVLWVDVSSDDSYSNIQKMSYSSYSDVAMDIVSPWINLGEIAEFWRFVRLIITGNKITDTSLIVNLAYNYEPYWRQSNTIDLSSLEGFSYSDQYGAGSSDYQDNAMMIKVDSAVKKCTSFRFRITHASPPEAQAFEITSISFEVEKLTGAFKVDAGRIVE